MKYPQKKTASSRLLKVAPSERSSTTLDTQLRIIAIRNKERSFKWDGARLQRLIKLSGLSPEQFAAHAGLGNWRLKELLKSHSIKGPAAILFDLWEETFRKSTGYISLCPAINPVGVACRMLHALDAIATGECEDPVAEARKALAPLKDGQFQDPRTTRV